MAIIINTRVLSLTTQNKLGQTQNKLGKAVTRPFTGLRINGAASLAIGEGLTAQSRGIVQGQRNANDAISTVQTVDGSLPEVTNLLQRSCESSVESASDLNNAGAGKSLNDEVTPNLAEIGRLAASLIRSTSNQA